MEAPQIVTADPSVLKNLLRCPGLTVMQTAALNTLLANGKTQIGWVGFLRIGLGELGVCVCESNLNMKSRNDGRGLGLGGSRCRGEGVWGGNRGGDTMLKHI